MKNNKIFNGHYLLYFALFFFVTCINNKKQIDYFKKIENEQELQSAILFSSKNDSLSTVKFNILQSFYNEQRKSFNYDSFNDLLKNLDNLSNSEKQLLYFTTNYKFDESVKKIQHLSFDKKVQSLSLVSNSKGGYLLSPSKYSKEKLFSILYLFYKDQSYVLFDDNIGQYLILNSKKAIK